MIFLRPWLLGLILIPILFSLLKKRIHTHSVWESVIDKKLLPYLLIHKKEGKQQAWKKIEWIVWVLFTLAAAGPAWDKIEVPTQMQLPGTVIITELSPALSETELKQIHIKLYDILNQLKSEQVGLVLYDNTGYTAVPLTPDLEIIKNVIPALSPTVLPESGLNVLAGFQEAQKLFQNAGLKAGRILFITSGAFNPDELKTYIKQVPYPLAILGIGDKDGQPIPLPQGGFLTDAQGRPILSRLNPQQLNTFGVYQQARPDSSDIKSLLQGTHSGSSALFSDMPNHQKTAIWNDRGILFLILALPFFCLLFRKGFYYVLILSLWALPLHAGLWVRADQEQYLKAQEGITAYRNQKYDRAEQLFSDTSDAKSLYNKGNALAFQNKIDEAIDAYEQALKINPNDKDALYNKRYLEDQKKQAEQEQKKNQGRSDQGNKKESDNTSQQNHSQPQEQKGNEAKGEKEEDQSINEPGSQKSSSQNEGQDSAQDSAKGKNNRHDQDRQQSPHQDKEEMTQSKSSAAQQSQSETQQDIQGNASDISKSQDQGHQSTHGSSRQNQPKASQNQPWDQKESEGQREQGQASEKKLGKESNNNPPSSKDEYTDSKQNDSKEIENRPKDNSSIPSAKFQGDSVSQKQEERQPDIPSFDQTSQQILNKLKQNPEQVLKYRIYQQYQKQHGGK